MGSNFHAVCAFLRRRISPLSLWNAASSAMSADLIVEGMEKYARYSIPKNVVNEIREQISRYGKVKLVKEENGELVIISNEKGFLQEIANHRAVQPFIQERLSNDKIVVKKEYRGHIKQALIKIGFPVEDLAGYDEGNKYAFNLKATSETGNKFGMRDYQLLLVEKNLECAITNVRLSKFFMRVVAMKVDQVL